MQQKRSFAGNLLSRMGGGGAAAATVADDYYADSFEDWPAEELVFRLRQDGVDVPPDSNPHDLVAFANAYYTTSRPRRYTEAAVEFVDSAGVQYVPRPRHRHPPAQPPQQISAYPEYEFDHATYHTHNPPMFASEMTQAERIHVQQQQSDLGIDDDVHFVEEEIDTVSHYGDDEDTRNIREDFRFIEDEEATAHRIKSEFQKPSKEVAQRFEQLNHPRRLNGKRYSICCTNTEGSTSELAKYGIGISLHFKILKWLFWTFLVMSVIALPQMIFNLTGGSRTSSLNTLDATTLGHIAVELFFVNDTSQSVFRRYVNVPVDLPFCQDGGGNATCQIERESLAMFYSITDLINMLIFFLALKWMQYFVKVEGAKITKHHITVEEYTVQVVRIPPETTEMQLKRFFSDLTGEPVHEVFLVQDNGDLLSLYVKRGKVINKLWKQAAEIHLLKEERRAKPGQKRAFTDDRALQNRLDRAVRAYDRTYALFLDLNEQRAKKSPGTKSLGAFVTFETQQGFLKTMDLYPQNFWARRKQPLELRLDPKKPLKVRQAPPPTTILWENTHHTWRSRQNRRTVTMISTLFMLCISVVVCFYTERERYQLKSTLLADSCAMISSQGNQSVYDLAKDLGLLQRGDFEAEARAREDPELRNCYCSSMNFGEAVSSLVTMSSVCYSYYAIKAPQYALTFVATLVIAMVNIALQQAIYSLSLFEKHHSLVNMELSITKRVFAVIFINTGLILLCVNARLVGLEWVGSGRFSDFAPDWYPSVGTNIILTMTLNIITPQIFPMVTYSLFKSRQRTHVAFSQRELNEQYLGGTFLLSYRTAQLTMTVFVTMLYSSGMPCLYPIACASFVVAFYCDKFLLLNYCRTPPAYSERLAMWFSDIMPYAIMCHLGFACWMYSTEGVFWDGVNFEASSVVEYFGFGNVTFEGDGGYNFGARLSMAHIVPLYTALFIMISLNLLSFAFHSFDKLRAMCCVTVTCGIFDDGVIKRRYLNPDYTDAVEDGQLRGLINYNILENPTYSRALGIDAKFAKEHRHVASVHEASAVDLPVLPRSFSVKPAAEVEAADAEQRRVASLDARRRSLVVAAADVDDEAARRNSAPVTNRQSRRLSEAATRDRADSTTRAAAISNAFFRGSIVESKEDDEPASPQPPDLPPRARNESMSSNRPRNSSAIGARARGESESGRDRAANLGRVFAVNQDYY